MVAGSTASNSDAVPANSPVLSGFSPTAGISMRFKNPSGSVANGPGVAPNGAEGGATSVSHSTGPENGIANITAPVNSLIGVFLTDAIPEISVPPGPLNFSSSQSRNYTQIKPAIRQPFFIGNGNDGNRTVVVPQGATRIYLGVMDGQAWNNNSGSFTISVCRV
jgi:hypothetical protein